MARAILVVVALGLLAAPALSQVEPDEAQAKLKQKAEQRKAERAKLVQISAGQLEDMQGEIIRLRAAVADLQKRLNPHAAQAAAKPGAKRNFNNLEVGMTKDELLEFVKHNSHTYSVTSIRQAVQGGTSAVETTHVRRQGSQGVAVNAADPFSAQTAQTAGQETVTADATITHVAEQKHETIMLASYRGEPVSIGHSVDALGHSREEYGTRFVESGHIEVSLTNDVVTAINAFAGR